MGIRRDQWDCKKMTSQENISSRGGYNSSFHYLLLLPDNAGQSFKKFLLYFRNKDIGKLDLAISDTILRKEFFRRLGYFYEKRKITSAGEFKMIANRSVSLVTCKTLPDLSISKQIFSITFCQCINTNKHTLQILKIAWYYYLAC